SLRIELNSDVEDDYVCVKQISVSRDSSAGISANEAQYIQLPEKKDLKNKIVMFCIHGTADHPGAFKNFAHILLHAGLPESISSIRLVSFEKRFRGTSLFQFAEQLCKKIVDEGIFRVILAGH